MLKLEGPTEKDDGLGMEDGLGVGVDNRELNGVPFTDPLIPKNHFCFRTETFPSTPACPSPPSPTRLSPSSSSPNSGFLPKNLLAQL
jgi:hypothetical protein